MATLQIRRGTTAKVAAATPAAGELLLDTQTNRLVVGDGSTAGGKPILTSRVGVVDASNAAAGEIGEYLRADSTGSVTLSNAVAANIASITLTPGDWDLQGIGVFVTPASAGGSNWALSLSTTANTMATDAAYISNLQPGTASTLAMTVRLSTPTCRFNVSANTTVYLIGVCAFGSGTNTVTGSIRARRVR